MTDTEYPAKILLLGRTGAGKSSFINYFLGREVAKAGFGKPVTQEYFIPYEMKDGRFPIQIFDTKGVEALQADQQLEYILNGIKAQNKNSDIFNWFHTIFYCVSMADNRFQDFEASFIRRIQAELSQHIHIILTHCDTCSQETIAHMRAYIMSQLEDKSGVEIFEVVSVHRKKRNGECAVPRGRELVYERVFDLLLEDIAYKLSVDYSYTLYWALNSIVCSAFADLRRFVDKTVRFKTLFQLIMDEDRNWQAIDGRLERMFSQMEKDILVLQEQTDSRFREILYPAAKLYTSYLCEVTAQDFVEGAGLSFSDSLEFADLSWIDGLDENYLLNMVFPRVGKYMDENGDFQDDDDMSVSEMLRMIRDGVGDIIHLRKNIKALLQQLFLLVWAAIPSLEQIQKEAYERIVQFINPDWTQDAQPGRDCGEPEQI